MTKRKNKKSLNGFTLIEILISIVILSILFSIAIPFYQNYKAKTLISSVGQNLNNCAVILISNQCIDSNSNNTIFCKIENNICKIQIEPQGNITLPEPCILQLKGIKIKCQVTNETQHLYGKFKCKKF